MCFPSFSPGDVLCEIQTDKAIIAMEFDEEGTMAKILHTVPSSEIAVGTPIAIVAEAGEDWRTVNVCE